MNFKFTELTKSKTSTNSDTRKNIQQNVISSDDALYRKLYKPENLLKDRLIVFLKIMALTTSGLVAALSMPGFNYSTLAWFAFIPLIIMLTLEKSVNKSLLYSFSFGLGFYSLTLNWFLALHPLGWMGLDNLQSIALSSSIWIGVSAYLSCYMLLFGLIARMFTNLSVGPVFKSVLISFCWVIIMNKMTSVGPFAFPWALIEYSQYKNTNLLQIAQYIGGIGIGFLIMYFNCMLSFIIVNFLKKSQKSNSLIFNTACIALMVFAIHFAGGVILKGESIFKIPLSATIIQNNSTLENKQNELAELPKIKQSIISQIKDSPPGLVVLPEAAISDFIRYEDKSFYKSLDKMARDQNKTLIIGALDLTYNDKRKTSPTNSAFVIDKNLDLSSNNVYNKQFLVPFGEYIPFRKNLPDFLKGIANSISDFDFYPGNKTKVIDTSIGNIAPTICYEIVFPDLIRKQIENKADILVNLSSLCWYHDSIIKDQFIAFGVMRAAEFRRPYIIAVNTGYSVFIDYNGKILKQTSKNKSVLETMNLNNNYEETFFSKLFL